MNAEHIHKADHTHSVRRKPTAVAESQPRSVSRQPNISSLQRLVGNQEVQRMISQGMLGSKLQRCATCSGDKEEM